MSTPQEKPEPVHRGRVYDAICDLWDSELGATPETICKLTGLVRSVVSEQIDVLKEQEKIYAPFRGAYRPTYQHAEPRAMSFSPLKDGCIKVDLGDLVLVFPPKEARMFARGLGGVMQDAAQIELGQATSVIAIQLAEKVRKLERRLDAALAPKSDPAQKALLDLV